MTIQYLNQYGTDSNNSSTLHLYITIKHNKNQSPQRKVEQNNKELRQLAIPSAPQLVQFPTPQTHSTRQLKLISSDIKHLWKIRNKNYQFPSKTKTLPSTPTTLWSTIRSTICNTTPQTRLWTTSMPTTWVPSSASTQSWRMLSPLIGREKSWPECMSVTTMTVKPQPSTHS